ncbi:MAG: DNA topoisomerase I [Candidatus Hodarchaeota archaeon]
MTTLIITEKPTACSRIARSLDENKTLEEHTEKGVTFFKVSRDEEEIFLVSALGHLYNLTQRGTGWIYPTFNMTWKPSYKVSRRASNTKNFIEVIEKLAGNASTFINACDYDLEGSLIGYCVLKYACGVDASKKAKRMRFSTLTKSDLIKAYENVSPHLDYEMVEAGKTRHEVDWLFGINLTRALTLSLKNISGYYHTIGTGRVQGPTLSFVMDRERKVRSFVPIPYWTISAEATINNEPFPLDYSKSKIWIKDEAERVVEDCKGREGIVSSIMKREYKQKPPIPFNTGGLQVAAYSLFGYTPSRTLNIAERLYLAALISYPRTSSQKIPPSVNGREILKSLAENPDYEELANELLKLENLVPNQGKKDDPAHPCIHPTGNLPDKDLSGPEKRLYDLIVRRFMATFGESAIKLSVRTSIDFGEHTFFLNGREILSLGWLKFYGPYARTDEVLLPPLEEGQKLSLSHLQSDEKFTSPPSRYNPSSLLKLMEEEQLGTKATRAGIIDILFRRGYIRGHPISITDLGSSVVSVLEKHCPDVLSPELTRDLERDMDDIQNGRKKRTDVLLNTVNTLKPILEKFKFRESEIGTELTDALQKLWRQQRVLGKCPVCETGELTVIISRTTRKRFVGCSNYREGGCNATFPLPQKGSLEPLNKECRHCGYPTARVIQKGRRPWNMCVNWLDCPGRKTSGKGRKKGKK